MFVYLDIRKGDVQQHNNMSGAIDHIVLPGIALARTEGS